jgi:hypothetical protein
MIYASEKKNYEFINKDCDFAKYGWGWFSSGIVEESKFFK